MDVYCEAPLKSLKGKTPIEVFTGGQVTSEPRLWKPWGCPVYVLDNALQQNKPKQKWSDRSRVGIYLGRSPFHARTVALVMSLATGRVSPQFHVQFDPSFQTVKKSFGGTSPPSLWQQVCGFSNASRVSPESNIKTRSGDDGRADRAGPTLNTAPNSLNAPYASLDTGELEGDDWSDAGSVDIPAAILQEPVLTQEHDDNDDGDQTVRRSTCTRIPVVGNRLVDLANEVLFATSVQDNDLAEDPKPSAPAQVEIFCESALFPFDLIPFEDDPLLAYGASNDPDVFYYHEAMREPDADEFRKAMEKEIEGQWDNGNFKLFKRKDVPADKNILPGV